MYVSQTTSPAFFAAYQSLKLSRDAQGVLLVEFHTKGGPLIFTAQDHTEFVDAFFRIAEDRANKIVIFTGTSGEFIPGIDFRRSAMSPTRCLEPSARRRCSDSRKPRVNISLGKEKSHEQHGKPFIPPGA